MRERALAVALLLPRPQLPPHALLLLDQLPPHALLQQTLVELGVEISAVVAFLQLSALINYDRI